MGIGPVLSVLDFIRISHCFTWKVRFRKATQHKDVESKVEEEMLPTTMPAPGYPSPMFVEGLGSFAFCWPSSFLIFHIVFNCTKPFQSV